MPQPQLPPPSTRMADRINLDFRNGRPSNNLEGAGVILHQFDAMDDRDPDHHPWELGIGRRDTGDRVSAAIVNAQMQPDPSGNIPIYSFSLAGLVLSPTHNNLMCSYSWDVGSMERKCWPQGLSDICIPGCSRGNNDREPWCAAGSGDWKFRNPPCAWRPQNLADMLAARDEVRNNQLRPPGKMWNDNKYYTELIFETRSYTLHLPDSIMGVFYLDDDCGDSYSGPKCADYGKAAHRSIAKQYSLNAERLPLLKLDLWNWEQPFTEIEITSEISITAAPTPSGQRD